MDPLKTRPILTGWEFTMEPYPSGQFGFIDDPDRQFGNDSVWTRTRTRRDGPEPLLTLHSIDAQYQNVAVTAPRSLLPSKAASLLYMNSSEQITFQLSCLLIQKSLTLR